MRGVHAFFDKAHRRIIPVPTVDPALDPIEVELVHPEHDGDVFRLPLLLIGISVPHPHVAHDPAASGIVPIMRRRHKRHAVSFHPLDDGPRGLRRNSPMPELLAEPVAKVMVLLHGDVYVTDGAPVFFQAYRIGIRLRQRIQGDVSPLIERLRFLEALNGVPRQEPVCLLIPKDQEQCVEIPFRKCAQYQTPGLQGGRIHPHLP